LPLLSGPLPRLNGELMADGGLVEAVPFQSALAEGATHVLVLRSRAAEHRKHPANVATLTAVAHQHPALRKLVYEQPRLYNEAAATLAEVERDPHLRDRVRQIAIAGEDVVSRLERDRARIVAGQQAGARAIAAALSREPSELLWQPQAYRVSAPGLPETSPRAATPASQGRLHRPLPLPARALLERRPLPGRVSWSWSRPSRRRAGP
jgi:predicted acylesterase/phospholipase RssA